LEVATNAEETLAPTAASISGIPSYTRFSKRPVTLGASYGSAGVFPVIAPHEYCAMWEAGPAGAIVTYRVKPIRAAR